MTRALVPLAHGVEEMEAVINIDTPSSCAMGSRLRICSVWSEGNSSETSTLDSKEMLGKAIKVSRGVRLLPDAEWSNIEPDSFDVLVLPGGRGGAEALSYLPFKIL